MQYHTHHRPVPFVLATAKMNRFIEIYLCQEVPDSNDQPGKILERFFETRKDSSGGPNVWISIFWESLLQIISSYSLIMSRIDVVAPLKS
jgi:hypothetical protein